MNQRKVVCFPVFPGGQIIQMGVAQTASVARNLTMEYVRRVDASPREDFYERSSRNLGDDKGVFIAIFFSQARR